LAIVDTTLLASSGKVEAQEATHVLRRFAQMLGTVLNLDTNRCGFAAHGFTRCYLSTFPQSYTKKIIAGDVREE
jgi:hypothetical protein